MSGRGKQQPDSRAELRAEPPRIAVVLTGGTIQSAGKDRLDLSAYMENRHRLSAEELLSCIPELADLARVRSVQFTTVPSPALEEANWLDLVRLVHELVEAEGAEGVVITHGTHTLEETAYFLHLTLKTAAPVVLTGAMRPASAMSGDGELNLLNAVRTARDPVAAGMGVLVLLNDTIYSARDVTKGATYRVNAFCGRDLGPLGFADSDNKVAFYHRPVRPHTVETGFDVRALSSLPSVPVVLSHIGADATMIDAAVAAGARGLVVAGSGSGGVSRAQDEALTRAQERGVLVCISGRVGSGRVVQRPGVAQRGFVTSDNLVPWKARILLSLALTTTRNPQEIQALFDRY